MESQVLITTQDKTKEMSETPTLDLKDQLQLSLGDQPLSKEDTESLVRSARNEFKSPPRVKQIPLNLQPKSKKKGIVERKLIEKRKNWMNEAALLTYEMGAFDWMDVLPSNQSTLSISTIANNRQLKPNPYANLNTAQFWFYVSLLFFPKHKQKTLFQDPKSLLNAIRKNAGSRSKSNVNLLQQKDWDVEFQQHRKQFGRFFQIVRRQLAKIARKQRITHFEQEKETQTFESTPVAQINIEVLIQKLERQQQKTGYFIDEQFARLSNKVRTQKQTDFGHKPEHNELVNEVWCNDKLAEHYFQSQEKLFLSQKQEQVQSKKGPAPFKPQSLAFANLLAHEKCLVCSGDEYDSENYKVQCLLCECTVHSECIGEKAEVVVENGDDNDVWICPVCRINKEIGDEGYLKNFQPACVFCNLKGSLMRPTRSQPLEVRQIPGFSTSNQNTLITLSAVTRKEREYQVKMQELRAAGVDTTGLSSTFVLWGHLSCAAWLPQIPFDRKKPIQFRSFALLKDNYSHNQLCEQCGSSEGLLIKCSHIDQPEDTKKNYLQQFLHDLVAPEYSDSLAKCKNFVHVECARRADYYMEFLPASDRYEVYCQSHRPFNLKRELQRSFWDQVDQVVAFAESFKESIKKYKEFQTWTERDEKQLLLNIASVYRKMPQLRLQFNQNWSGSNCSTFIRSSNAQRKPSELDDWQSVLTLDEFPWEEVAFKKRSALSCWEQLWEMIGPNKQEFQKQVLGLSCSQIKRLEQDEKRASLKNVIVPKICVAEPVVEKRDIPVPETILQPIRKGVSTLKIRPSQPQSRKARVDKMQLKNQIEQRKLEKASNLKTPVKNGEVDNFSFGPDATCCYCRVPQKDIKDMQSMKTVPNFSFETLARQLPNLEQKDVQKLASNLQQGIRCSKSGITRCSNQANCRLGMYFHITCCYKKDQTFSVQNKSRFKWFCQECVKDFQKKPSRRNRSPSLPPVKPPQPCPEANTLPTVVSRAKKVAVSHLQPKALQLVMQSLSGTFERSSNEEEQKSLAFISKKKVASTVKKLSSKKTLGLKPKAASTKKLVPLLGGRSRKKTEEETKLLLELANVFPNVKKIFREDFCEEDLNQFNTHASNTPKEMYLDEEKIWQPQQECPSNASNEAKPHSPELSAAPASGCPDKSKIIPSNLTEDSRPKGQFLIRIRYPPDFKRD